MARQRKKSQSTGRKKSQTPPAKPASTTNPTDPSLPANPQHAVTLADLRPSIGDALLVETAWEAVNQVGGIYTVIRTKLAAMTERWGRRYCLLGPYMPQTASIEFEHAMPSGPFGQAAKALNDRGIKAHYGHWIVSGKPQVVLFELGSGYEFIDEQRHRLASDHGINIPTDDVMINDTVALGYLVEQFLAELANKEAEKRPIIAHFHEWMAGVAIPAIRKRNIPITTVFTTHATLLGRYVAANDPWYYDHVPFVDWQTDAKRFNIEPQVRIERAAAHGAHVLTTVSDITGYECEHLLGRKIDGVTPNGLNIERFTALHEFQNLHRQHKDQINEFVMGHFFPSYTFDLDQTLYVFTSGRYEYSNKGYDMTIEALARLNHKLKQERSGRTVIAFLITRRPTHGLNADVLRTRAVMDELRDTCDEIKESVGRKLFQATAMGKQPALDDLLDDYWRLRLRRTQQAWKTRRWPTIVTHDLVDPNDEVIQQLRTCNLLNSADDPVKIVYHPDFIEAANPLWGMDYDQFVRGCHIGVFPSYYEPWGYTPLECVARGIPSITTDVSGFGSYVMQNVEDPEGSGIAVLRRRYASFELASEQLANQMLAWTNLGRRDRIELRNRVDRASEQFDWRNLISHYDNAYDLALERAF